MIGKIPSPVEGAFQPKTRSRSSPSTATSQPAFSSISGSASKSWNSANGDSDKPLNGNIGGNVLRRMSRCTRILLKASSVKVSGGGYGIFVAGSLWCR